MTVHLARGADTGQIIHEVGWHLHKQVTTEAYRQDLAYACEQALEIHEWRGQDRDHRALTVVWIAPPNGRLLAAYTIQGRL
jgi:hypothetical protein